MIKKGYEQMKKQVIYNDTITKCGIMLNLKDEMYLIKDGKKMRLNAFIIKESRRESN